MALFEQLAVGIGVSVASAALKLWYPDHGLFVDPAKTALDLLGKKLLDERKTRVAKRNLERLGDRCAESFEGFYEKELSSITKEQFAIVANAAAAVLDATPVPAEFSVSQNVDPMRLRDFYLERSGSEGGNPGFAKHENPEVRDLYERLLLHASQQIVSLASALPAYTDAIFTELLVGQDRLYQIGDDSLERLDRLVARQAGIDLDAERFETNYRNACDVEFGRLSLFGVDLQPSTRRYSLDVAYIQLHMRTRGRAAHWSGSPTARQALACGPRLLIRGAGGSGKTTFLQWVTVFCAARRHERDLAFANELVPFVIRLREAGERLPVPDEFPSLVSRGLPKAPPGWADRILASGRGIILVDGLDEVPEARREEVRNWLSWLVQEYPKARFVVTTRPHAVEEGCLDAEGFVETTVTDLSSEDVDIFVRRWHEAIAENLRDEREREVLRQLSDSLVATLRENANLARLATSPLLCAMICALHRDRIRNLPTGRLELYRECVRMFYRRDDERGIDARSYVSLSETQKQQILQHFAYWMLTIGYSSVSEEEAVAALERAAKLIQNLPTDATGATILKLFTERVGLLQELARDRIGFPHRSFQEYLAACEIVATGDLALLTKHAHEDEMWREAAVMVPGLMVNPEQAEDAIVAYLSRGDRNKQVRYVMYLIAAAALVLVARLPPDSKIHAEVASRIAKIAQSEMPSDASSLDEADSLVVPVPRYRDDLDEDRPAATPSGMRRLAFRNLADEVSELQAVWSAFEICVADSETPFLDLRFVAERFPELPPIDVGIACRILTDRGLARIVYRAVADTGVTVVQDYEEPMDVPDAVRIDDENVDVVAIAQGLLVDGGER